MLEAFAIASMILGVTTAAAQSQTDRSGLTHAVIVGSVLKPDGSGPLEGARITLSNATQGNAVAISDNQGEFRISVPAGSYNFGIADEHGQGITFLGVLFPEGEQDFPPIKLEYTTTATVTVTAMSNEYTTMGVLSPVRTKYSLPFILRHPVIYLKHLMRKN
jgi:hypothetical protein